MVLFDANLKAFRLENYIRTRTMNRIKSVESTPFTAIMHFFSPTISTSRLLLHKVDSHKLLAKPWALMVWSVLVWGKVSLGGDCRGRMGKETKAAGSPGVLNKKVMDPIALDQWLKRNLNELNNTTTILMISRFSWKTWKFIHFIPNLHP